MTFVIAAVVVVLVILVGALLAWIFASADRAVDKTKTAIDQEDKAYNPALTLGHRIKVTADKQEQVLEARKLAAKQAAALPRGANMRIGRLGAENSAGASKGLKQDPFTAAKIAAFHGWDGAKAGVPAGGVPAAGAAPVAAPAAAPAKGGKIELVPGKDYPVIEITDDMSPDEVRKARIANAKAKSAATKAAKEAGVAPAAAPAAAPARQAAPQAAAPVATGIEPPQLIEITDDMSPDEVRKARISNAKAKSAYNKALKEAGYDPKEVEAGTVVPQPAVAQAPVPEATTAVAASPAGVPADPAALGIEPPELIEITDDMSPDEIRKARIANAKANSAYNKALKEAGIDPQAVAAGTAAPQPQPTPAPAPPQATTPEPSPSVTAAEEASAGTPDLLSLGIEKPQLVEITDDMSPDDIRQARIANAKAKSAFNKALKEAGIDPKTVEV